MFEWEEKVKNGFFELAGLLPPDLAKGIAPGLHWQVPSWAFMPDQWSWPFLRGLKKMKVSPREKIWEVGVGSGLNVLFLLKWYQQVQVFYSDYNEDCGLLTGRNLRVAGSSNGRLHPLPGSWDLVGTGRQKPPQVHTVVGCIPQVILPEGQKLVAGNNEAHYYDPSSYGESLLHHLGLGLNEALLVRARRVLVPGGRVALNLGGRPRLDFLLRMFENYRYKPQVLHQEVIPQHVGTVLNRFVEMELSGAAQFEFYSDLGARRLITAQEAEWRRRSGKPLFHKIYVIEGKMA